MTFNPKDYVMDMRGKDYLEVKWRIVWFRDEHPRGSITTDLISTDPIVVKATVSDEEGRVFGTGFGTPKMQGVAKARPFEGAETAAIGRALAVAGYGTQFTGEDEGEHLADSPVEKLITEITGTPEPKGRKPTPQVENAPHKKKPEVVKWLVSEKIANNVPNAGALYDLVNSQGEGGNIDKLLNASKGEEVRDLFRLYRRWRTEGGLDPQPAAIFALEGKTPEGEPNE